jgi:addiction module HigA family antidote
MKNPPHPGLGIRDDIEALGLSVAEAADGLGITRQQLYNVLKGKSGISPDMAVRLEKGIGSDAETWLKLQAAYDLAQARQRASRIDVKRLAPRQAAA